MTATPGQTEVVIWITERPFHWGILLAGHSLLDAITHPSPKVAERIAREFCKTAGFEVEKEVLRPKKAKRVYPPKDEGR